MTVTEDDKEKTAIALAALVKMIGLLSAELVIGSHRDDVNIVENNIRAKLYATLPGVSTEATAAGVALAHRLVEPLLRDLHTRAAALTPHKPVEELAAALPSAPPRSRMQ